MNAVRSGFSRIRAGMTAFGFDGAEIGKVVEVSRRQGVMHIENSDLITLILPMSVVGLISEHFVMLRGTASQFFRSTMSDHESREDGRRLSAGVPALQTVPGAWPGGPTNGRGRAR